MSANQNPGNPYNSPPSGYLAAVGDAQLAIAKAGAAGTAGTDAASTEYPAWWKPQKVTRPTQSVPDGFDQKRASYAAAKAGATDAYVAGTIVNAIKYYLEGNK